ncbi:MAG: macrolide transporter [Gammaproteobacteria bacterium]|nr:macrolide transporter [Gammaproteobacteria bacterium]|tara:strand:- start:1397 stop:2587 length:1191 start_codon:yes stop_codon:yes gene_type:complete
MKKYIHLLIVILFLSNCGGGNDNKDAQFYKKQETVPQTLEVSIEASGVIEAISSVEIKSKASGEVLFLGAEVGDFVDKGFMLAQIDQRTANNIVDQTMSDLDAAKVRLINAESQYERGIELHKNSSISDKDFEDIKENYAQAKSTLVRNEVSYENAKISLDDTVVKSPIHGTVISRPVEVGQVISSPTSAFGEGSILMTMADLSKVRVRALVDEIDVGKVSIGQTVSIKVAAYRDKEFIGTVSKIEPKAYIQQNVTTFPVLIDINNKDNLLLIGMNTDVVIEILNRDVTLSVPTMSLRTRKDVYTAASLLDIKKENIDLFLKDTVEGENFNRFIVIKDSRKGPYLSWVKIGVSDLYNVEVVEGLDEGDIVYILPSKSLFDYQQRFKERVSGSFSFG